MQLFTYHNSIHTIYIYTINIYMYIWHMDMYDIWFCDGFELEMNVLCEFPCWAANWGAVIGIRGPPAVLGEVQTLQKKNWYIYIYKNYIPNTEPGQQCVE